MMSIEMNYEKKYTAKQIQSSENNPHILTFIQKFQGAYVYHI